MANFNVIFCCFIIYLNLALSRAYENLAKNMDKRQTDSFVVQANYGVQTEHLTTSPTIIQDNYNFAADKGNPTEQKLLPTPSAWIGANNFLIGSYTHDQGHLKNMSSVKENKFVDIYKRNHQSFKRPKGLSNFRTEKKQTLDNIVIGSTTDPSILTNQIISNKRLDSDHDVHHVQDLQKIIESITRRSSKIHRVLRVPAVYEIHLQEDNPIHNLENFDIPQLQKSQTGWNNFIPTYNKSPNYYYLSKNNQRSQNSRGMHHITTTWNLPTKIQYFNRLLDHNGQYPHPRPFAPNKWQNSQNAKNNVPFEGWNNPSKFEESDVQVPISPGSTSVTVKALDGQLFHSYSQKSNKNMGEMPNLDLYYAKKRKMDAKEIPSRNYLGSKQFVKGRSSHSSSRLGFQRRHTFKERFPSFSGVNYMIYVREKA